MPAKNNHHCPCGRRHDCLAWAPTPKHPLLWVCRQCLPKARELYHMTQRDWDVYEQRAIEAGGDAAGAYLDSLGKTDLGELEVAEYKEFCRRLVGGYSSALSEAVATLEAPF